MPSSRNPKNLRVLVAMPSYGPTDLAVDSLRTLAAERLEMPGLCVGICENGTGAHATRQLVDAIQREGWSDWAYVHEMAPNRGFAGGTNAVLRDGLSWPEPPDYFWLLNTDTLVQPGATAKLIAMMASDASLGIVTPQLVGRDGTPQNALFRRHSPWTEFLRAAGTGALNRLVGRAAFPLEVLPNAEPEWASFAAAFVRRDVVQQVGFLDDGYFLYFEDSDYGWRTRRAGWRIGICREARVVHLEGGSNDAPEASRVGKRRAPYYYASRARYFAKLYGTSGLWTANLAFMAGRVVALFRRWLPGKPPIACLRETRDNWNNCRSPLQPSPAHAAVPDDAVDRVIGAMPSGPVAGRVSVPGDVSNAESNQNVHEQRRVDRS